MVHDTQAVSLVAALLEGEDPKEFFKRHMLPRAQAAGDKFVAAYELEDIGIDHNQYFTGRGTSHTDWDDVYVGVGDNPLESIEDALDQAAMDGWPVDMISTAEFQDHPSVAEEYPDDEEGSMQYYTAVYLRQPGEGEQPIGPTQEAEDPKSFLKRMSQNPPLPNTWPQFKRWQKYNSFKPLERRRAFHMVKRHQIRRDPTGAIARDPEGQAIYDPYEIRHSLRNTRFYRDKAAGEHWVEFHRTNVVTWDRLGNAVVDHGGYRTISTRDRINMFLPHSWRIHSYHGDWYWYNHDWPQNIRDRLSADQYARRKPEFPWWIDFNRQDYIRPDGTLVFGNSSHKDSKRGLCKPTGELKHENWEGLRPPPQGVLQPPRRRRGGGYDPNQLLMQLEGKYMRRLARWKRVKAKHDTLKAVEKAKRELDTIDEPDKKKKKKGPHSLLR